MATAEKVKIQQPVDGIVLTLTMEEAKYLRRRVGGTHGHDWGNVAPNEAHGVYTVLRRAIGDGLY